MYDSLDTMLLMGLHDEFADALSVVQEGDFSQVRLPFSLVPVFPAFSTVCLLWSNLHLALWSLRLAHLRWTVTRACFNATETLSPRL